MKSPSAQLAELIIDRLITEEIILPEDRTAALQRLTDGKFESADWKLAVEKSLEKRE